MILFVRPCHTLHLCVNQVEPDAVPVLASCAMSLVTNIWCNTLSPIQSTPCICVFVVFQQFSHSFRSQYLRVPPQCILLPCVQCLLLHIWCNTLSPVQSTPCICVLFFL